MRKYLIQMYKAKRRSLSHTRVNRHGEISLKESFWVLVVQVLEVLNRQCSGNHLNHSAVSVAEDIKSTSKK